MGMSKAAQNFQQPKFGRLKFLGLISMDEDCIMVDELDPMVEVDSMHLGPSLESRVKENLGPSWTSLKL
jgi:hypothetical protein